MHTYIHERPHAQNTQAYIHILAHTRTLSYTLTRNTQLNTSKPTHRQHSYTLTFTSKLTNIPDINTHAYSDTHAQHTQKQYTIHKHSRKHSHKLDTHTHAYSHTNHDGKNKQTHTRTHTLTHIHKTLTYTHAHCHTLTLIFAPHTHTLTHTHYLAHAHLHRGHMHASYTLTHAHLHTRTFIVHQTYELTICHIYRLAHPRVH